MTNIAYRTLAGFQPGQASLTRRTVRTGAVTLIQRLGSALSLNVHFHRLLPGSITHRIAVGPHLGWKVFTLQTVAAKGGVEGSGERLPKVSGFSLHAGMVAEARLSLTAQELVCYRLNTPYRDGTTAPDEMRGVQWIMS